MDPTNRPSNRFLALGLALGLVLLLAACGGPSEVASGGDAVPGVWNEGRWNEVAWQ